LIGGPAQDRVRCLFECLGASVGRIAESDRPRADFLVSWPNVSCVVEVKGKEENEEYARCLHDSGRAWRSESMGRTNPISRQVREAIEQVRDTPDTSTAFRVLALVAADDAAELHAARFKSTLYGLVDIVTPSDSGEAEARPCFYFTYSEFPSAPDIDAAVILAGLGSLLCLNEFSLRLDEFRSTPLYQVHSSCGAVLDPAALEAIGKAYSLKGDLPRKDPKAMLALLKQKYGLSIAYDVCFIRTAAAAVVQRRDGGLEMTE